MDFRPKTLEKPKTIPPFIPPILWGLDAAFAEFLTYPLENIKVRMQMNQAKNYSTEYSSTIDCIKKTIKGHGILGFYRGVKVSTTREFFFHATKFSTYDYVKRFFLADIEGSGYYRRLLSALSASSISLFLCNVLDITKTRFIADLHTKTYKRSKDILFGLLRSGQAFKGYTANFFRQSFFMGAELFGQDQLRIFLVKKKGFRKDSNFVLLTSGVVGSVLASVVSCPFDVLRTRYMSQIGDDVDQLFRNARRCFVYMVKNEGILSLYRGFIPFMLKNCLFSTSLFVLYEQTSNSIQDFKI
jgi:Mitochondrial carrier protein.